MIYTRFGTPVVAVRDYDEDTGEISAKREGRVRYDLRCHVSELKADGGIAEILGAVRPGTDKAAGRMSLGEAVWGPGGCYDDAE